MARIAFVGAALTCAALAGPASGAEEPSRHISTPWIIAPSGALPGERALAGGDFVLKQRLLPMGLAELAGPVTMGSNRFEAGTQFFKAKSDGASIYCRPYVPDKVLVGCLLDSDSDGDFDEWFDVVSQTKGLPSVAQKYTKKRKPVSGAAYRQVPVTSMTDEYFVAIERRNYFNIYSRESFMIVFGREGTTDRLTAPVSFKSAEMPKQLTILGAVFTAVAERDGKMVVTVQRDMPMQPFAVVKTTSYGFY
ncbi:hypothetical protein [Sphingopyxis sp. YR583]|uniref:hypothetical protein n=1 Tax=Sphingopyxis sp. YR583 TaxID=1881047 RepID=UPI00115FA858|nr:hypothetical protein [Sphingopyxis sp. YR583]